MRATENDLIAAKEILTQVRLILESRDLQKPFTVRVGKFIWPTSTNKLLDEWLEKVMIRSKLVKTTIYTYPDGVAEVLT